MKQIILLFFLVFFIFNSGFSQEKNIKKGDKEFNQFEYVNSREVYLKVVDKGYTSQDLYQHLGDSYYFTAKLQEALKWYEPLIQNYGDTVDPEYYFRYAQSLKSLKRYKEADEMMEKFYSMKPLDSRALSFGNQKNYLKNIELQSGRFDISTLSINSENSDFAPTFYKNELVFASSRPEGNKSIKKHAWNNQPFSDLYVYSQDNEKQEITSLSKKINTKYHESTAVFSKDGNTVYFTRNNYTRKKYEKDSSGTNLLKIYRSQKVDDKWQEAEELPFNNNEYAIANPALSPDGKTLYFASNMPGGKGLSDLYKVSIGENDFGTPINLGEKINTEGRETFPYMSANGDLYFSSDGHLGLGGLDIFVAMQNEEGDFKEIFNIGEPINSPLDDFTFIINSETGIGYFASNRDGGNGSDDIYKFKQNAPLIINCLQELAGTIYNKENNETIAGASVVLLDDSGTVISETFSLKDGSFNFHEISCEKTYAIRVMKNNFSPDEVIFSTSFVHAEKLNKSLYLNPITPIVIGADLNELLDLNPIYFDYDKSFIRHDSELELQKVIEFMKEHRNLKIDVRSHTDSRGRDAYNLKLSQQRNTSTLAYLIEGGVFENNLTGKGYGETQLKNGCSNGIKCSKEEHQLNRRSEFIIVEK